MISVLTTCHPAVGSGAHLVAHGEQADQEVAQPDRAAEVSKLEQEIAHLIGIAASGKGGADLGDAIDTRRARIKLLQEAMVEPVVPVTKKVFLGAYTKFRLMIRQDNPDAVRSLLRKIGIDRLVVTKTEDGWSYDADVDLTDIVRNGEEEKSGSPETTST
jgi:hypothetical protein